MAYIVGGGVYNIAIEAAVGIEHGWFYNLLIHLNCLISHGWMHYSILVIMANFRGRACLPAEEVWAYQTRNDWTPRVKLDDHGTVRWPTVGEKRSFKAKQKRITHCQCHIQFYCGTYWGSRGMTCRHVPPAGIGSKRNIGKVMRRNDAWLRQ
jgi:hypothetical protein